MRKRILSMVAGVVLAIGVSGEALAGPIGPAGPVLRQQFTPSVETTTPDDYSGLSNDVDSNADDSHSNE